MDSSSDISSVTKPSGDGHTILIDFTWKKLQARITERGVPDDALYYVDMHASKPHLVFKTTEAANTTFASGTLRYFSINADCDIHGKKIKLRAMSRFKTKYTHRSEVLKQNLFWTDHMGLKTWDFMCTDESGAPVARIVCEMWAYKKLGRIEFMTQTVDPALRDEIVVTSFTLANMMALRINNIFNLVGAVFAKPVDVKELDAESQEAAALDDPDSDDSGFAKPMMKDPSIVEVSAKS